ncbi:carboxypeptidase-like regulatory domain-containing protein, partial [Aquimarina sp. MMG015]
MNHKITIALLLSLLYHFTSYSQENYELTGTVTSIETNTPIPGVSVLVIGTSTGSVTDFDGKYSINVKSGDVVQFSYIGLTTKNVTISGQTTLNVSMEEDSEALEEIVVVGYGSQRKSDVT